jgi:hypothetical protein
MENETYDTDTTCTFMSVGIAALRLIEKLKHAQKLEDSTPEKSGKPDPRDEHQPIHEDTCPVTPTETGCPDAVKGPRPASGLSTVGRPLLEVMLLPLHVGAEDG